MARWTESLQDQKQIAEIGTNMPIGGITLITLLDGTQVEGVLRRVNAGNNAGHGGWKYYGECEIQDRKNQRWVIDFLDMKSAIKIWNEAKAAEYEELGLITISKD